MSPGCNPAGVRAAGSSEAQPGKGLHQAPSGCWRRSSLCISRTEMTISSPAVSQGPLAAPKGHRCFFAYKPSHNILAYSSEAENPSLFFSAACGGRILYSEIEPWARHPITFATFYCSEARHRSCSPSRGGDGTKVWTPGGGLSLGIALGSVRPIKQRTQGHSNW